MYSENPIFNSREKNSENEISDLESVENKQNRKDEFTEKIVSEKEIAEKDFADLIEMVNERYKNLPEKMREDYILHNSEILQGTVEIGMILEMSKEDLRKLELAAIWHDACKAEKAPEGFEDVPNYVLAMHGEMASREIENIMTDEFLTEKGFAQEDFRNIREEISRAILQHMGPHPGFMDGILEETNRKLKSLGKEEVTHPKAEGKISEALLAADMRSLAGTGGRKKVLSIRESVPFFKQQDDALCEEYAKFGISLKPCEAALLSGFDSAFQARDMMEDERLKVWIQSSIDESMEEEYQSSSYPEIKMTWNEVSMKREQFIDAKKTNEELERMREDLAA